MLKRTRLELIDSIRGVTLISMMIYHFCWNMVYLYGNKWTWFHNSKIWQQSICWTFIIISGFSFSLGNRPLKRGLMVFCGGFIVTLVTLIFMPQNLIIFGILTLIGSSMLVMVPLKKVFKKLPLVFGLVASLIIFLLTKNCYKGYLGFSWFRLNLPDFLYKNYLTAFLGFPSHSFYSTDYFPFFPWFFLFVFGFFLYHYLEKFDLNTKLFSKGKFPVVNFLGKHSLFVYLLHQPIIYGVCEAVKYIF